MKYLLLLIVLFASVDSFAGNFNITKVAGLAEACRHVVIESEGREEVDWNGYGQCFGYFRGVKDSYDIQVAYTGKRGNICIPKGVTWLQIIEAFLKWSDARPEKRHEKSWVGLVNALSNKFPCSDIR